MFQKLRESSERTKKLVALGVSGVVTLGMFWAWLFWGAHSPVQDNRATYTVAQEETPSVFSGMGHAIGSVFTMLQRSAKEFSASLGVKFFSKEVKYKSE